MRAYYALLIVAFLSACGGGGGFGAPPNPVQRSAGTLKLVVGPTGSILPGSTTGSRAKPRFISPSAKSVSITANGALPATIADISAGSPNCTGSAGSRTCTITVQAPLGNDTFAIVIFDGPNATGNQLGSASATANVTPSGFSVTATVNAVVASYMLTLSTPSLNPGTNTATLTAVAKDADGNVITGPGGFANPITITNGDKSGAFTLSATSFTGPGQSITISHNSAASCANLTTLIASAPGAPSQSVTLSGTGTSLYVTNLGDVTGPVLQFPAPYTSAPKMLYSALNPDNLAFDLQSNLFVSVAGAGFVQENAPPYTGSPSAVIGSGQFRTPQGVAVDNKGNLFAADFGNNRVLQSASPHPAAAVPIITGLNSPTGVALDPACNLFVSDANSVREYTPPYNGSPIATVTSGLNGPRGMTFDGSGNLFVANFAGNTVVEFAPPYTGAPIATIALPANASPNDLAFDPNGNLVVAEYQANKIIFLAPPFTGSPALTITSGLSLPTGVKFAPPVSAPPPGLHLYMTQLGNDSVTVTPSNANGNAAPIRTIIGANTQLSQPYGITVDGSGDSYASGLRNATVTIYAPGANGNVAPIRTLNGSSTGLNGPLGLAIDSSGDLIVSNFFASIVTVYAPGANGNVAPIRTISGGNTGLGQTYGLTLDSAGNLYVVNNKSQFGGVDSVTVYAPGANGNVAPIRAITGNATGMSGAVFDVVDAAGNLYVSNATAHSITKYAPGANGNAAPIATIAGSNTGLAQTGGIVLDSSGNIYVDNDGNNSVEVFAAGANGNVAPIRTIIGPNTGITSPVGLALAP